MCLVLSPQSLRLALFTFLFLLFHGSDFQHYVLHFAYSFFCPVIQLLMPSSVFFFPVIIFFICVCFFLKCSISLLKIYNTSQICMSSLHGAMIIFSVWFQFQYVCCQSKHKNIFFLMVPAEVPRADSNSGMAWVTYPSLKQSLESREVVTKVARHPWIFWNSEVWGHSSVPCGLMMV